MFDAGDLATALWRARAEGGVIRSQAADGLASVEMAYGVQRRITSLAGLSRLGWKVGVTSRVAQRLLGVEVPATGPLFAEDCFDSPAEIAVFPGQDASVESEFAFRFARDLPPRGAVYGRAEVLAAVGAVLPAIEVVGCRFEGGFGGLGAVRLIADMTANTAWVKGPECRDWRRMDLIGHRVGLRRDGETVAEGVGANALGDPLNVLEWTANHLSALGDGIKAGEVVSTGTCTGVTPVAPGETLIADFGTLGRVEVRIIAAASTREGSGRSMGP
ncbi:MAG: hydratase [Proteobacteria bacterium]|nr:hydratase [Pseudomonadota bacterium]